MRADRIARLGSMLRETGSAAIVSPSSDLYYLLGLRLMADERLTVGLFWPDATAEMVVPALYAAEVEARLPSIENAVWDDGDDPYSLVAAGVKAWGITTVLVDDRMRAEHLLRLQSAMPDVRWGAASSLLRVLRRVKDPEEMLMLRKSARLADAVLQAVLPRIRSGMTESDVAWLLQREVRGRGGEGFAFPPLVASGPNSALPHYQAGSREIQDGDVLLIDFGCVVDGYCSDMTRMVVLGPPPRRLMEVYATVRRAYEEAMKAVRPGAVCQDIDGAARRVIIESGYEDYFVHRTGHGIGLDYHEEPYIVEGNTGALVPGMAFSVEPGIYLPGQFGVRLEDIVLVGERGADNLGGFPRELVEIGVRV
ncbi:MAG: M24 family metallopeptidase [Ignavibacteriales bacterium]